MNKHFIKTAMALAATVFLALSVNAQTNTNTATASNVISQTLSKLSLAQIASVSNYTVAPYMTYAPDGPDNARVGGGVLVIYNVNEYVGGAAGLDYLGRFSLLSANLTLKMPIKVSQFIELPAPLDNLVITPFTLGGIGTPMSGAAQPATIWDVGAAIQFGHFAGGTFNTGACYGEWMNAGEYSGKRYHIFIGWSKGF